ncbi:hypothetical protein [Mesorhizobium argentiipisi]|uniref:Uncharacterized protein n=1 Tax=Mesorhizobium argentiipisi TaxID=3015175 RepID=A0ABU8KJB2_9HYPH
MDASAHNTPPAAEVCTPVACRSLLPLANALAGAVTVLFEMIWARRRTPQGAKKLADWFPMVGETSKFFCGDFLFKIQSVTF